MNRMVKNLMVVLIAALMFFTSVMTPVHAESASEEPVETPTEEVEETPAEQPAETPAEEVKETPVEEPANENAEPDTNGNVEGDPAEAAEPETPGQDVVGADELIQSKIKAKGTLTEEVLELAEDGGLQTEEVAEVTADTNSETDEANSGTEPSIDETIKASKDLIDNEDGTSTLSLSVKGQTDSADDDNVHKVNVLLVLDRSNSMKEATEYVFDQKTYDDSYRYFSNTRTENGLTVPSDEIYHDENGWYSTDGWYRYDYSGTVYISRLTATQMAINALSTELMAKNNKYENLIEVKVISFASYRGSARQNPGTTESSWYKGTSNAELMSIVNNDDTYGGTNWQAALEYAKEQLDQKKNTDGAGEGYYCVFLTDGEPTFYGHGTNQNRKRYRDYWGDWHNSDDGDGDYTGYLGPGNDYSTYGQTFANTAAKAIRDTVVNSESDPVEKYNFYSIFTFGGSQDTNKNYLRRTTVYAYDGVDYSGNNQDAQRKKYDNKYFYDATSITSLMSAFQNILDEITKTVAYGNVSFKDGVSTDVTASTLVAGQPSGFKYEVSGEIGTVYSATAEEVNGNTVVKFKVGSSDSEVNGIPVTDDSGKILYYYAEGYPDYKMALATYGSDGQVNWDLSAIGTLGDYTYKVSFIVWPEQDAYDYVAGLNNLPNQYSWTDEGTTVYEDSKGNQYRKATPILDAEGKITGYKGGCKYPSIIKYLPDGPYAILTNTDQSITYSIVKTEVINGVPTTTTTDPTTLPMDSADPMKLTGSQIDLEKVWDDSLDPAQLAELMFGKDYETKPVFQDHKVVLSVYVDGSKTAYKSFTFPKVNEKGEPIKKGTESEIATSVEELIWSDELSIAPGIMLSKAEAEEIGLVDANNSQGYKTVTITDPVLDKDGNVIVVEGTYYILHDSEGHDYEVKETSAGDLHFEFNAVTYHPMLVNGTLYNMEFVTEMDSTGKETIKNGSEAKVVEAEELKTIKGINTLKGGIDIKKYVGISSDFAKEVTEGETKKIAIDETKLAKDYNGEVAYTVKLTDAKGNPVITPADQYTLENGELVNYKSGFMAYNVYDENGNRIKRLPITAAETVIAMPAKGYIRIANVPAGTNYEITEIVDANNVFNYLMTSAEVKAGTETTYVESVDTNTYTGKVSGNSSSIVSYYNWSNSCFYVYHSSNNEVERIYFTDPAVTRTYNTQINKYVYEFNIYAKSADGTLYGGYYSDYAGKSSEFDATKLSEDDWADNQYTDINGESYNYVYIKDNNRNVWDYAKGYAESGLTMSDPDKNSYILGKDMTYYLKEVPTGYLQPYTHYTYYKANGNISTLYEMTAIDDACYQDVGFIVTIVNDKADKKATVVNSVKISATHTASSKITLNAAKVFAAYGVKAGWICYTKDMAQVVKNKTAEITQYWVTKDGINVSGIQKRTLTGANNKKTITKTDAPYIPEE